MATERIEREGTLGLLSCVTIIVGGMMGSAIFSLSGITIYYAGPAAILSWVIAALVLFMYGLQVAELSTIFPKSGGVFVFPSRSLGKTERHGKIWGALSTWGYVNANIVAIAFAAIYVATYLGVGFPVFSRLQIPLSRGCTRVSGKHLKERRLGLVKRTHKRDLVAGIDRERELPHRSFILAPDRQPFDGKDFLADLTCGGKSYVRRLSARRLDIVDR